MTIVQAIILAIVEGITEYLPISSTGHMIIASSMMGIQQNDFVKMFTVAIQFGAILSVVVLYWRKFIQSFRFYALLLVAFIPAAVMGKLFNDQIDALLENAFVVGVSLLIGGVFLLFINRIFTQSSEYTNDEITPKRAFVIGCFQIIAMIPGVSRSAATIVGGLQQKLTRKAAAEFSFFLAVPTMFAATIYKMYKYTQSGYTFQSDELTALIIGNLVAFAVAMVAIKGFVAYLTKNGFAVFGWYRVVIGLLIIGLYAAGVPLKIV
jgi:undecaprenyl-diphosphatase